MRALYILPHADDAAVRRTGSRASDHRVTHAVVKRVFGELRVRAGWPKRLAFVTLTADQAEEAQSVFALSNSTAEEIKLRCPGRARGHRRLPARARQLRRGSHGGR